MLVANREPIMFSQFFNVYQTLLWLKRQSDLIYSPAYLGHMISNGRSVAVTRQRFEMFYFTVNLTDALSSQHRTYITIPAASLIL